MNPSVRSRLWAAAVTFAVGFGIANYGLLMITKPDQWLWLLAAGVLMLTGAAGVVFADADSSFSVWLLLGVEVLVAFTLIPIGWMLSLALGGPNTHTLWPSEPGWSNFSAVLDSATFRHGALNSLIVAGTSTAIAVFLAAPAAYAIVRWKVRGKRWLYAAILAALFAPVVAFVGPLFELAAGAGLDDSKRGLTLAYLIVTLPLALWLFVSLFAQVPWSLRDAARADGATRLQLWRTVDAPVLGTGVITVVLTVFFLACNDLVLGLSLATTPTAMPAAATIATFTSGFADPTAATAAAGLLCFAPIFLFVLVFHRNIARLLGRPDR